MSFKSFEELERLLELCKKYGVEKFRLGDLEILIPKHPAITMQEEIDRQRRSGG